MVAGDGRDLRDGEAGGRAGRGAARGRGSAPSLSAELRLSPAREDHGVDAAVRRGGHAALPERAVTTVSRAVLIFCVLVAVAGCGPPAFRNVDASRDTRAAFNWDEDDCRQRNLYRNSLPRWGEHNALSLSRRRRGTRGGMHAISRLAAAGRSLTFRALRSGPCRSRSSTAGSFSWSAHWARRSTISRPRPG